MRPQELRSGQLSTRGLNGWAALVALVAVGLRLSVHFEFGHSLPAPPAGFTEFLGSADHIWSSAPMSGLILSIAHTFAAPATILIAIELVAVVTVVGLLAQLGDRWLDYRVGLLAAALWAFCGPAIAVFLEPDSEGWQAALSILCAAAMLRVARRRAPRESWRIGVIAGLTTLFGAGGLVWAVAAVFWLPVTSRKFRGRNWAIVAGLVLAGWAAMVAPVAVRNAVVTGGNPSVPLAREIVAPSTGSEADAPFSTPSEGTGFGWGTMARRLVAPLGGWLPEPENGATYTGVPWWWLSILAWLGIVALLPGARFLFPLMLGGLVPLLRGMVFGLDSGTILTATPFVCLYAGYALWRLARGWRSLATWLVAPPVFGLACLVHSVVRGWI